jgi:hypothetical protein
MPVGGPSIVCRPQLPGSPLPLAGHWVPFTAQKVTKLDAVALTFGGFGSGTRSMAVPEWSSTDFSADPAAMNNRDETPRACPYWPAGATAPVRAHPLQRSGITFVAAQAVGFLLHGPRRASAVFLCFDLSDWPADDPVIASGSVYEAVVRLVGAPARQEKCQDRFLKGPALTRVLA